MTPMSCVICCYHFLFFHFFKTLDPQPTRSHNRFSHHIFAVTLSPKRYSSHQYFPGTLLCLLLTPGGAGKE